MLLFLHPSIQRTNGKKYEETSAKMVELAQKIPGFLGVESVRNENGFGNTTVYWKDKESIKAWRNHKKHKKAKKRGRAIWYEKYFLRIVKVENNYGKI
jgi:heme-degrading monooxygenase HmoA